MNHPFLTDPERRRAFEHLCAVPTGSVRTWAEQLAWSRQKMERFLMSLVRYQLGEVITTPFGSTFRPSATPITAFPQKVYSGILPVSDTSRDASRFRPGPLGSTGVKSTGPSARTRKPGANSVTEVPFSFYASRLIPVMNEEFGRLLSDYLPVRPDSRGSHKAGHELEAAKVDPDWCEQRLREMCRAFNPSKHGGGEPPRTLAYFERGLIRDWRQYRLNLLTVESNEMAAVPTLEARPSDVALESASPPAPPQLPLSSEAMTAWRTAFESAQPGKRLGIA